MGSPTRLIGAAALLVLIVLLATACGSSTSASSSTTTTTAAAAGAGGGGNRQGLASFQACLSKAGVKIPVGGAGGLPGGGQPPAGAGQPPAGAGQPPAGAGQGPPGGGGFGNLTAAQRKAISACSSKLPASARNGLGRRPGGQSNPAFAKYTACLRKHGVTFGSSNNQAAFKKASAACAKLAPAAAG